MNGGLDGLRVVVTRAEHQAGGLGSLLEARGAAVVYLPVIELASPERWDEVDDALRRAGAGDFEWVVFASANAAAFAAARDGAGALAGARVLAVGPRTAAALREHGVHADLVPVEFTADSAVAALGRGRGRVLLLRPADAPHAVVEALRAAGWRPEEVVAYRNLPAARPPAADAVTRLRFDAVTFTSGSTVRNFTTMMGPPATVGLDASGDKVVACIGPATAGAARRLGLRVDVVAAEHTAAGLVEALAAHVTEARMAR